MPVVSVDQDKLNEIMRVKRLVKGSIDGVMDGTLTAGHLASDVQLLLDLLDGLQASPIEAQPQPTPPPAETSAPQPEQVPPQPEIQPEQAQPEPEPLPEPPQPVQVLPEPGRPIDEIPISVDIPETPLQDDL